MDSRLRGKDKGDSIGFPPARERLASLYTPFSLFYSLYSILFIMFSMLYFLYCIGFPPARERQGGFYWIPACARHERLRELNEVKDKRVSVFSIVLNSRLVGKDKRVSILHILFLSLFSYKTFNMPTTLASLFQNVP